MFVVIVFAFFILYFYLKSFKSGNYPPGPTPLPLIGNLLSVCLKLKETNNHYKLWQVWAHQYGAILGLRLGLVNVVVVSGSDYIREVSSSEVFSGRPNGFFYTMRSFGKKLGIVFSDGPKWSQTKHFVLKYLKDYGYNTGHMDIYIGDECLAFVKMRMMDAGTPIQVNTMFHVTIVNILWRLVAGKRYNLNDVRVQNLCNKITRLFKAVDMSGGILNFLPFLRHIVPNLIGYRDLRSIHSELHAFLKETIEEHRCTIDVNNPRDVIDAFLIEMSEQNESSFTEEDLQVICLDLLEGGMETVSNTAVFMLLHLVRNPEVQRKIQEEIDEIIGHHSSPMATNRTRMVYTEAVVLESLRISSVAAVGIPHMALQDARLGKYVIPKGTVILLAMYDLHNGCHWTDPESFRPERFITENGKLVQGECFMPFGVGKRRCIGEGLARSQLFMFLTHILQQFQLKVPEGEPLPSPEPIDGLTLSARPFEIIFQPRFQYNSKN